MANCSAVIGSGTWLIVAWFSRSSCLNLSMSNPGDDAIKSSLIIFNVGY